MSFRIISSSNNLYRFTHIHSHEEILERYNDSLVMCERMPEVFATAMGDQMYTALMDSEDEVREYGLFILDDQAPVVIPSLYSGIAD